MTGAISALDKVIAVHNRSVLEVCDNVAPLFLVAAEPLGKVGGPGLIAVQVNDPGRSQSLHCSSSQVAVMGSVDNPFHPNRNAGTEAVDNVHRRIGRAVIYD